MWRQSRFLRIRVSYATITESYGKGVICNINSPRPTKQQIQTKTIVIYIVNFKRQNQTSERRYYGRLHGAHTITDYSLVHTCYQQPDSLGMVWPSIVFWIGVILLQLLPRSEITIQGPRNRIGHCPTLEWNDFINALHNKALEPTDVTHQRVGHEFWSASPKYYSVPTCLAPIQK
jgi:hypothetical protein